LAAETVLSARGKYGRPDLEPYRRALAARFGTGQRRVFPPVPAGLVAAAGRRLFRTSWFAKRVVLDRWFLHADLPALRTAQTPIGP
jgi:hypothetical protein